MSERTRYSAVVCELCRRPVDSQTAARARRSWRPLVVCDECVRDARSPAMTTERPLAAAA